MAEPRACPGPDPAPRGPSRFAVPAGAVDTHAHVIGPPPYVAARSYTAPQAPAAAYLAMLNATGMAHGVLVQVSVHGTDNRLLLDTLRHAGGRLRGVAVIAGDEGDAALLAMAEASVRGVRINNLYGGGVGPEHLERIGAICRGLGWHMQLLLDARTLPDLQSRLARVPVPLVVDHMGHFPAALGVGSPGFRALLTLVREGAWVKLSGAYRLAEPPYAETVPLAHALLDAAPDRCVWGSDWPHVAHWSAMPNVGGLLDVLADWAVDDDARQRVLVENPSRLYGF